MYVEGTDGADNLNGTDLDDQIVGKKGNDYLFGFGGNDLFTYSTGHDVASSDGSDGIDGGAGIDTFQANVDYVTFLSGRNSYTSPTYYNLGAGSDGSVVFTLSQDWSNFNTSASGTYRSTITLKGVENFTFSGTHDPAPQSTYPILYSTDDRVTVGDLSSTGLTGQVDFDTGSGNDTLDAHAATTPILALGGAGNDTLTGGSGNDTLYGQDGNDILTAGGGVNTLVGGTGDDTYYSDNTSNTLLEQPNEGYDTLYTSATYVLLASNIEKLAFTGTADFTGIGNAGDNWIQGGIGNNYLVGLDGNDTLYGGGGFANALQGGKGDDTYIVENGNDTLIEFANEGHDTVLTTLTQVTLRDNFEDLRYSGTGNFIGTGNDADNFIQGSAGNDHLIGLGGNDTLDGGAGANVLEGGTGDDRYIVQSSADTIIERAWEGHDTVQTTLTSFVLPTNVEDLDIQNGGGSFTGNDLANVIRVLGTGSTVYGAAGNDVLIGGVGNDILSGGAGNDTLIGGLGGDELAGGSGADHFVFTTANDGADLIHDFSTAEDDKIDVSQLLSSLGPVGADPFADGVLTFQPIAAFGSSGVPATRVLLDVDGSAGAAAPTTLVVVLGGTTTINHNDFIIDGIDGTDGNDQIASTKGDDYLFGRGGNDLFTYSFAYSTPFNGSNGDGRDVVDGGSGNDTFQVSASYWQAEPGSSEPVRYNLSGSGLFTVSQHWTLPFPPHGTPDTGTTILGSATLNSVENFSFMGTHDPAPPSVGLVESSTDDYLTVGDLSSTALTGQIYFDGGSGNDVLDAHATGNAILALGGAGNDTFIAGSGSNTLVGGTGDDAYYSDNTSDTLVEQPNEGYDTLYTSATYVLLTSNIEKLQYTGTADFTGIGNAGDNWIQGNSGADYLVGLDGNDVLYGAGGLANELQGGKGDDIYCVENPGDTLTEFADEGHDTVLTTLSELTLRDNIEDLRYSATGNFIGTGNDADNFIQGNTGNDHLIGLGGNDTLDGGAGANVLEGGTGDDRYIVQSSADTIIEQAGEGHDTVQTTLTTFVLPTNVEDLDIQNGGGSFTGNDLANVIRVLGTGSKVYSAGGDDTVVGGAGNDILSGGAGNDTLIGGLGGDELAGGSGADHFIFKTANDGVDLIHDFSHAEGDKIDVSQLLSSLGPVGADPFADGVLTFQPVASFGSTGVPATRVLLDVDGSAGAAAPTTLFVAVGSTAMFDHSDFIIA